ncbi:MAG: DASH complex subunit ask1 [Pleopsidium flavum]|nr:MAG: DASH complex subunit ask1 [Pleopsidium flavum]
MSRASSSNQRNLSLTEELEKLEQSITLTLQGRFHSLMQSIIEVDKLTMASEIDHNFSRAHRIVTTSILPIVEQYAEHSKNVWDGSKVFTPNSMLCTLRLMSLFQFWKQFFEASANVSLSGYEELAADETIMEDSTVDPSNTSDPYASSPSHANDDTITADSTDHPHTTFDEGEDSLLDSLSNSPSHSTPRATHPQPKPPTFAEYPSPYETLKREVHGTTTSDDPPLASSDLPSTPGKQKLPDMSLTPKSSPFAPPTSAFLPANQQRKDLLLHRVLDKNYRLQATPHTQPRSIHRAAQTPKTSKGKHRESTSPMSSPPIPAPELHSEIFSSPQRRPPRTPGVSVLTPVGKRTTGFSKNTTKTGTWDSDSDSDGDGDGLLEGMSPPKTMQFHVPQSRLLQTPAREASKRIVEDILRTAGGGDMTDELNNLEDTTSPSVVRQNGNAELEDSF